MTRNLAARPAPDLQQPGVEVGILLQDRKSNTKTPISLGEPRERERRVPRGERLFIGEF